MRYIWAILCCVVLAMFFGCSGSVEPLGPGEFRLSYQNGQDYPVQGREMTVEFKPEQEGSTKMIFVFPVEYGGVAEKAFNMPGDMETFRRNVTIPETAFYMRVYVLGPDMTSPIANTQELVFTDKGIPAEHGLALISSNHPVPDSAELYMEKELELYPDNAMAYINRWLNYILDDRTTEVIRDMHRIIAMPENIAEKDAALAYGLAFLNEGDSAMVHLRKYLATPEPKWGPRVSMPFLALFDVVEYRDVFLRAALANTEHTGAGLIADAYIASDHAAEDPMFEKLMQEDYHHRPQEGYVNFLYLLTVKHDTTGALTFLDSFQKRLTDTILTIDNPKTGPAFVDGAELAIDRKEIDRATSYLLIAEQLVDDRDIKGQLMFHKARLADLKDESYDDYLKNAIVLGSIADVSDFLKKHRQSIKPIFAATAELCELSPKFNFDSSDERIVVANDGRLKLLLFRASGMERTELDRLDRFAKGRKGIDLYAVSDIPHRYLIQQDLMLENWDNIFQQRLYRYFEVTQVPRTIVIDGEGRIRYSGLKLPYDRDIVKLLELVAQK